MALYRALGSLLFFAWEAHAGGCGGLSEGSHTVVLMPAPVPEVSCPGRPVILSLQGLMPMSESTL